MQKVIDFLKGNDREVERVLTQKMKKFAEEENFEVALNYRNKLQLLDKLVRKQVSALAKDFNLDVFAFESNGIVSAINMLVVRGGKLVGGENVVVDSADDDIASYLLQYYQNNAPLCDEIVTDCVENARTLEDCNQRLCKSYDPRCRAQTRGEKTTSRTCPFKRFRRDDEARHAGRKKTTAHARRGETTLRASQSQHPSQPHGMLRYIAHLGHGKGGEHGGVRRRRTEKSALQKVSHKDG